MEPRARKYPRLAGQVAKRDQKERTPRRRNQQEGTPSRRGQQEGIPSHRHQQEGNRSRHGQQEGTPSCHVQQQVPPSGRDEQEGTPSHCDLQEKIPTSNQQEGTPSHRDQQMTPNHGNQQEVPPNHVNQKEVPPNHGNQQEVISTCHDQQEVTPPPNLHYTANNPLIRIRESTQTLSEAEASERTELQDMFQKLQGDIMKLLATKRRNVKLKVNTSFKAIQEKLDALLKSQQKRRERIYEEYAIEFGTFINTSGEDMAKIKAEAEKLAVIFREQQMAFQRYTIAHNQKMEAFQKICQCHFKNLNDLESFHEDELNTENNALQQNMSSL